MFHLFTVCVKRFCNFGNVLSLQQFDDDDITKMEQMVKDQLKDWLDENTDTTNFVDYFGPIYHTKPDQFTFGCGDKKMLRQISEHLQSTIRKKGYKYFQEQNSQCSQNSKRPGTDFDVNEEELQDELFNGVLNLLRPYGDYVISLFKKDMVEVTHENGEIKGHVRCVLCDTEIEAVKIKKKKRTEFYSQYWNGHKWILSNFANHHLQKVHRIANNTNQAPKKSDNDAGNSRINTNHSILQVPDLSKNLNIENFTDERM